MKYPWSSGIEEGKARPLDGLALAATVKEDLRGRIAALRSAGVEPGLGTLLVGDDRASELYVAAKHRDCEQVGISSIDLRLDASATQEQVEQAIDQLNQDESCTAFIVQLPLPAHLDTSALLRRINPAKDADGLHPENLGILVEDIDGTASAPKPCTPRGIIELLSANGVVLRGARVVVVGRGLTVGRPLSLLLTNRRNQATTVLCHTATKDLAAELSQADVVIAAAGVPGIIAAGDLKPGAVVVDVGVARRDGKVVGDVADGVEEVASWLSPNPGGVGPMTRAMLLTNVVEIAERSGRPVEISEPLNQVGGQ